jgi:hypothetical protein
MEEPKGDVLKCIVCGAEGVGIGFVHDCALIFRVRANDDPSLSCFLCRGSDHVHRPLMSSFYLGDARVTVGLHRHCYERARVMSDAREGG